MVMSYGRNPEESRWFKSWYDRVIKPAVELAGYVAVLPPAEEMLQGITNKALTHLMSDPMVIVDLGGVTPDADLDPTVMYELGIRHALGLSLVMMAWKGQRLPFDGGKLGIIMEGRAPIDLADNRTRLRKFIQAAASGQFDRPMDAIG